MYGNMGETGPQQNGPGYLVLTTTGVQLTYTTPFGAYCTYLFLPTGSLSTPMSAHAFWAGYTRDRRRNGQISDKEIS
ncbi:hypothetical protein M378DRAFT_167271, partial [Amanita muscaria Koide BX008]